MTPRQTHLALAAFALAALVGGVAALRYLPSLESNSPVRSDAARSAWSGALPTGLRSMALRVKPGAFPPAPPPALEAPAPQEPSVEVATLPQDDVEGSVSFPPAPPPARPEIVEKPTPLPPSRPANLAELADKFAETAATAPAAQPQATEVPATPPALANAPPPPRPQEPSARAAVEATSTAQESAPPTQVARAVEPTLRAAPEDAFQQEAPIRYGMGDQVFVRIFKQEGQLELWLRKSNSRFSLYKTYPICKWSGKLGPKLKEADYQSPEGFYSVSAKQLHPHSNYHRAFNVGYPNAFDRQNGRTGGLVMVHGACKSVGCFAMTDRGIEEIYAFVEAAMRAGQREVQVHIFPFRLTEHAIARETGGSWLAFVGAGGNYQHWTAFWHNLKEGYDIFEQTGEPPVAFACGDHYAFGAGDSSCRRIAGW
ncbi:murein L,D-transpeptidase [Methylocystis sp. FS]|uniref:L,D-transpeptidase family protein n=1 Tax=Methylocystis silviterrae TaxID=2743612 RepID=UPI001581982B|nr:murein L,D-transpeptidase family protein [Methylocystis silviterrae]NUJ79057.1 murein L,D-transpeptidase [Methylocystis silviterrae]